MVDDLGPERRDCPVDLSCVSHVDAMDVRRGVDVGLATCDEVVEDRHLVAGRDVRVRDMGADEPCSAGH
jgi:hypothetical protein